MFEILISQLHVVIITVFYCDVFIARFQDVLLLKATSQAALHSVRDCLALMKVQQQREQAAGR